MSLITNLYPSGGKYEEYDTTAKTYTQWSDTGVVVSQRALSDVEVQAFTDADARRLQDANRATLTGRAQAAIASNATFLALASPTNAQTLAQVQRLTKENNALIRLALGLLSDISDTA